MTWLERAQATRRYWALFHLGMLASFQVTMQVLVVASDAYRKDFVEGISQSLVFGLVALLWQFLNYGAAGLLALVVVLGLGRAYRSVAAFRATWIRFWFMLLSVVSAVIWQVASLIMRGVFG